MLNKSCFEFSDNSLILVLSGSVEQAQVERTSLFQWTDYRMRKSEILHLSSWPDTALLRGLG